MSKISLVPKAAPAPNPVIVEYARELLRRAEAGEIDAICVALINGEGAQNTFFEVGEWKRAAVSAVTLLQADVVDNARGR